MHLDYIFNKLSVLEIDLNYWIEVVLGNNKFNIEEKTIEIQIIYKCLYVVVSADISCRDLQLIRAAAAAARDRSCPRDTLA